MRSRVGASVAAAVVAVVMAACTPGTHRVDQPPTAAAPARTNPARTVPPAPEGPQLPRGGRSLLPEYRLVAYVGAPGSPGLGRLGVGSLDDRLDELETQAKRYAAGRAPQPTLELLATIVQDKPGRDGKWRNRLSDKVIGSYLAAARRHRALLLLGIQPGRARFIDEVKAYEKWLRQPDVGVALDPEWAMGPGQVPMQVFGHTDGRSVNEVTAWVAALVVRHGLPEKAVVVHELSPDIVRHESAIRARPGVVLVKSVDGIGSRAMKLDTWRRLTTRMPTAWHGGFKLFFQEDRRFGPLMTAAQVAGLRPQVEYLVFE